RTLLLYFIFSHYSRTLSSPSFFHFFSFSCFFFFFFFFNDPAPTEIYTLSLHDALPISSLPPPRNPLRRARRSPCCYRISSVRSRSEEHTSELQSRFDLVCRLLLEKKKKKIHIEKREYN